MKARNILTWGAIGVYAVLMIFFSDNWNVRFGALLGLSIVEGAIAAASIILERKQKKKLDYMDFVLIGICIITGGISIYRLMSPSCPIA